MGLYRRVIRITAEDSPNVRLARAQQALGQAPTGEMLYPGVLPWFDYVKRRQTWDAPRQAIGLDAKFYRGKSVLLYPPNWLDRSERAANDLKRGMIGPRIRRAKAMGVDPAEGGDRTCWTVVDEWGILEQIAYKTPNTNDIIDATIALGTKWAVPPEKWIFDRGGGKTHADRLRAMRPVSYAVQTVGFGESVLLEPKHGKTPLQMRKAQREDKYTYVNRRAQMYGELRELLDPANENPFGIPDDLYDLRAQLAAIPLLRDGEGRLYMLPKTRKPGQETRTKTLTELIGHSPDEADSLVLAIHGMLHTRFRPKAGI